MEKNWLKKLNVAATRPTKHPMLTKETVIAALQTVKDPEINLDVWTMGLIYNLDIEGENIKILMTYTTPFCPWGPELNQSITQKLTEIGAATVAIEVTFDPPYKMPDDLRALLGV